MRDRIEAKVRLSDKIKAGKWRSWDVPFKVPEKQRHPWKVCIVFDGNDQIVVVEQGCDLLYPIDPNDHTDCNSGYCLTQIGQFWYCVRC